MTLNEVLNNKEHMEWEKNVADYIEGTRNKKAVMAEIARRYYYGVSAYAIAKELGLAQTTVINKLKQIGVYEGKEHRQKCRERFVDK